MLQALLDARHYYVEDFGESGRSLASLMPPGCPPGLHEKAAQPGELNQPNASACEKAMLSMRLVISVKRFQPSMLVVMLGTNDAQHQHVRNQLLDQVAHVVEARLSLLLRVLRSRNGGAIGELPPYTLVLQPPPTMAEIPSWGIWAARGTCVHLAKPPRTYSIKTRTNTSTCKCAAMHTCMFNPKGCVKLNRCLMCGPNETVPVNSNPEGHESVQGCIRVDALEKVRLGVAWAAAASSRALKATAQANSSTDCGGGVFDAHQIALKPDWHLFMDPYHFRPAGAASIACHVLSTILKHKKHCGVFTSGPVGAALAKRHERFCIPVLQVAREPSTEGLRRLLPLEQELKRFSQGQGSPASLVPRVYNLSAQ